MFLARAITGGVVFGALMLAASGAFAQDDFLARRQNLMKGISATAKEVKAAVESKDYATVSVKVKDLADKWEMSAFAKNWPHNSTDPKSAAKAEIWQKWDDFMLKAWDGQQKALALVAAANSKDDAKVAEAYKAFGPVCGNCHTPYRAQPAKN